MIESLRSHTVNTLTELCRIERVAITSESEEEMQAFQEPLAGAWDYYVNSNQLLLELRGLTRNYPASSSLIEEARRLVSEDPNSSGSWNLAWLCLVKIRDTYVEQPIYAEAFFSLLSYKSLALIFFFYHRLDGC
jgi:hypothetical protein